jgi:hypothetical protein
VHQELAVELRWVQLSERLDLHPRSSRLCVFDCVCFPLFFSRERNLRRNGSWKTRKKLLLPGEMEMDMGGMEGLGLQHKKRLAQDHVDALRLAVQRLSAAFLPGSNDPGATSPTTTESPTRTCTSDNK